MTIKMIIATDKDFAIGGDNKILWHIPEDLAYFKEQTQNAVVIMGNNTMESLPFKNGLPKRLNVVLSRKVKKTPFLHEGSPTYISDLPRFLEWGTLYINTILQKDIWIIGGASVYEEFKDKVEEVHWTLVKGSYKGADTYFDMEWVLDKRKFKLESTKDLCEESNVCVYKKI